MSFNIERNGKKRVVIVGGGFGGLRIAQGLRKSNFQVVLVDKNNYHQFPPLIYQIATAGLNPSAISFPYRKLFEDRRDYYFRMAELTYIYPEKNSIQTSIGKFDYDYLVLANGTKTNFFNNANVEEWAIPMKTVPEAMGLRNTLLASFERSVTCSDEKERSEFLNIVIVGGGPSGVEIAGAISEMRRFVLPKDYPDMDISKVHIYLIEGGKRLLAGMSESSSEKAKEFLEQMNVEVKLNTFVTDYKNNQVLMSDGGSIGTRNIIWVGGVVANKLDGLPPEVKVRGGRIAVDEYNRVKGFKNIFAIGDVACMSGDPGYPNGHPQMAQAAIQQGTLLAKNLLAMERSEPPEQFRYKDLGCMATIGKNKAVAEISGWKFAGFFAWVLWMGVHLISILGVKNKFFVFMDWIWSYFTYDQSNRMILRSTQSKVITDIEARLKEHHGRKNAPIVPPAPEPDAPAPEPEAPAVPEEEAASAPEEAEETVAPGETFEAAEPEEAAEETAEEAAEETFAEAETAETGDAFEAAESEESAEEAEPEETFEEAETEETFADEPAEEPETEETFAGEEPEETAEEAGAEETDGEEKPARE